MRGGAGKTGALVRPMKWILGIDPGLHGALAFISNGQVHIEDMSVFAASTRREIDEAGILNILSMFEVEHAFYEKVHAMPHEGAVGAFSFGTGYGLVRGVLAGAGIPRTPVEPTVWKRAMGLPAGSPKDFSRHRAGELAPVAVHYFASKRGNGPKEQLQGRAEALLIAMYGARRLRA